MSSLPRAHELPKGMSRVLRAAMTIMAAWDSEVSSHGEEVARDLLALAPNGHEAAWYWAGLLHDIGKITVDPAILRKCGALTPQERQSMQHHSLRGAEILQSLNAPREVLQGAMYHHERWDGTGYPYDIRGKQIPIVARVLAVADVYAALTSDRPYRRAFTPAQAQLEIERNAGTQFDAEIVAQFFERENHVA